MKIFWWVRLFRKKPQALLSPPPEVSEAQVVKVEASHALTVIPDVIVVPQAKSLLEVESGSAADAGAIDPSLEAASPSVPDASEPALIEAPPAQPETHASLPAPVPQPRLPAAAQSEEWLRARALYFTAAQYAATMGSERILSPDLLFRLGLERQSSLVEPSPEFVPALQLAPSLVKLEPRPMAQFATASGHDTARSDPSGLVLSVDPLLLTLFFSNREAGPTVPVEATSDYLTQPALLERCVNLRDRVLQNWAARAAPLSIRRFYDLALTITRHAGTALLLCHNTAKAFARGGEAVRWQVVNRSRGEYRDGRSNYTAAVLHREGLLRSGPLAPPSMFFLLFSAHTFGTADSGDWYRFFAAATAAHFAASEQSRTPTLAPSPEAEQCAQWIDELALALRDPSAEWSPAYRGWLWVNSWTFFESGTYGCSPVSIRRENIASLRGAQFGLAEAAPAVHCNWNWLVPLKGARFDRPFDCAASIAERIVPEPRAEE